MFSGVPERFFFLLFLLLGKSSFRKSKMWVSNYFKPKMNEKSNKQTNKNYSTVTIGAFNVRRTKFCTIFGLSYDATVHNSLCYESSPFSYQNTMSLFSLKLHFWKETGNTVALTMYYRCILIIKAGCALQLIQGQLCAQCRYLCQPSSPSMCFNVRSLSSLSMAMYDPGCGWLILSGPPAGEWWEEGVTGESVCSGDVRSDLMWRLREDSGGDEGEEPWEE